MSLTTRTVANKHGAAACKTAPTVPNIGDQASPADLSPIIARLPLKNPFDTGQTAEAMTRQNRRRAARSTGLPWRAQAIEAALKGSKQYVNPIAAIQATRAMATAKAKQQATPAVSAPSATDTATSKRNTGSHPMYNQDQDQRQSTAAAGMSAQQPLPPFPVPNLATPRYLLIPTPPPGHYQYGPIRPVFAPPLQLPPPPMMPSQPRLAPIPDGITPHRQPYPKTGTRGLRNLNRLYKALRMHMQASLDSGLSHENVIWVLQKCHEKFQKMSLAKAERGREVDVLVKSAFKGVSGAAAMDKHGECLIVCPS